MLFRIRGVGSSGSAPTQNALGRRLHDRVGQWRFLDVRTHQSDSLSHILGQGHRLSQSDREIIDRGDDHRDGGQCGERQPIRASDRETPDPVVILRRIIDQLIQEIGRNDLTGKHGGSVPFQHTGLGQCGHRQAVKRIPFQV